MADWNLPTTASLYETEFIQQLSARLVDAVCLFNVDGSNIPANALKFNRAGAKFQERVGGAWEDKVLAIAGGGTGSANAAGARTNLGLGTIATQNASSVAITGGSMSGVGLSASDINSGTLGASYLANSGAVAGTYGDGTHVPVITVDAKGRITGISTAGLGADSIPTGVCIIWIDSNTCPTGFTRTAALDGRTLRFAATAGSTGGQDQHQHGMGHRHSMSHGHGASFSGNAGTTGGPSGNVFSSGDGGGQCSEAYHTHGFTPSGSVSVNGFTGETGDAPSWTANADSWPPYYTALLCRKN